MHPSQRALMGDTMRRALQRALPGMEIEIREELRQLSVLTALQEGQLDVAFAYADIAYMAYVGQLDRRLFDRLRGIATLNMSPVYILVRTDSAIHDLDDLQGHRVNLGQPGTRTALTVQIVLEAFGSNVTTSYELFQDALANLEDGTTDAVFAVGGYDPIDRLQQSISSGRVRLLSLSRATTSRLRREHPFVHPLMIPEGPYQTAPVLTIGIERLLLTRDDLDSSIVYEVTRAFFESLSELSSSDQQLREMHVEDAPATAVPLHEGAARYYREQDQM